MANNNDGQKALENGASVSTQPNERTHWYFRLISWFNDIPANGVITLLTLYLIFFLLFWGYLVLDIATQQFNFLSKISGAPVVPSDTLTLILLALCGGAIGGVVYSMDKLIKYATKEDNDFKMRHTGDYLVRHLVAATLGAVVFALVLGGFINVDQFVGSTGNSTSVFDTTSGYFAFALGFLTGFGSYQVTKKLDQIIKVVFGRFTEEDLQEFRPAIK